MTGDHLGHRAQKPDQVLVRVHAADIDEQRRQRRDSERARPRRHGRIVDDTKHRVGCFSDDIDAVPGNAQDLLDIRRRRLRHRHRARRLKLASAVFSCQRR